MPIKDYFSGHAKIYATFRPDYPNALYDFIYKHLHEKSRAWDCATGNGQVAKHLASMFDEVYATDISNKQLENAVQASNITYSVSSAEHTTFPDNYFDLITVGQALHWFQRELFYKEVMRTAKPNGLLAVWGYAVLSVDESIDELFNKFYTETVGPYWDDARKLVEDQYRSISFPFEEIPAPAFSIAVEWTKQQFAGYLSSWSSTQKFINSNGFNPVDDFITSLKNLWQDDELKNVTFPVFLRLGRIKK
ncbi:class I SAM-dependent methyltransferase [Chryseosolibacter indicus]|uniref:Methyltransferase domain-containing protein n=1 Tax=Chryseosolibacter indicus TaxID=2782351 RepID=A0ABS5VXU7_9BACT|nr:class I SAM-dependent methyltransferase [Chryseosolibacter indicus]MBT1705749.1 methyltransferase domain-containing protein [Chryseosolibacter indicus]